MGYVTAAVRATANLAMSKVAELSEDPGTMLNCSSLSQWLSPEADCHQGLRVARPMDPGHWQPLADLLWSTAPEQQDSLRYEEVSLDTLDGDAAIQARLQAAAHAVSSGLPPVLAEIVRNDALALADASRKLVPRPNQITMKLELFGTSTCARWHQDNYVSRALVSYNCSGTAYTEDSNVDFKELFYCGNNDCIIRDKARIRNVNVGDLVLIKGTKFPGKAQGLVHKSADVQYHTNGLVQSRILLKVDMKTADEEIEPTTTPAAVSPLGLRSIGWAELAAHNTEVSSWIAIDGMVYDVTNFKHPGGLHRIRLHAGTDATSAFRTVRHSSRAQRYMGNMLLGRLADEA